MTFSTELSHQCGRLSPGRLCGNFYHHGFHPVHLGDVYNGRYEVLRKLGYGRYSTVWLVKDQRCCCYRVLKFLSTECYSGAEDIFELEILKHLRDSNSEHPGYRYIPTLVDSFEHVGPKGRHTCLVLEPMGESLASFGTLFSKHQVPNPIMQRFTKQLLLALDYAHQSGIIHTDIQPRNIMIQITDFSIIDDYLKATPADPAAYDSTSDSSTIVSQPLRDFYIRESSDLLTLNVALCDWGSASWTDHHLTEVIQPGLLRAPEVIIGAPWGPTIDIWSIGAVLLEVLDAVRLFDGRVAQTGGVYKTKHHIEEMHGGIRDPISRPEALLENWIESLTGNDKEEFVNLLKSMMKIDPDGRKTAKQLLDEPWLQHTSLDI
ncbi:kinase-like domain-containing protein [Aspergillus varians]